MICITCKINKCGIYDFNIVPFYDLTLRVCIIPSLAEVIFLYSFLLIYKIYSYMNIYKYYYK